MAKRILVTGATGKQGGAVANALLAHGHAVRALVRDPSKPAAKALADRGVTLVKGDLDDAQSIAAAIAETDGVFAMATPFGGGLEKETQHGNALADAAKKSGSFLVYSSVGSADRATGIPHFESKYVVEKHIAAESVRGTILGPVYFMDNLLSGKASLANGVYTSPLTPSRLLKQVAVADIAAAVVSVFEHPSSHAGKRYDLVGDELTGEDCARILSAAIGKPIAYRQVPIEAIRDRMGEDAALMFQWFERVGYSGDRAALAKAFPDVKWTSFEAFVRALDWKELLAG